MEQNGQSQILDDVTTTSKQPSRTFTFVAGNKAAEFLKEGDARLVLTAKSNDLRGAIADLDAERHGCAAAADDRRRWPPALHQSGRRRTGHARSGRQLDGRRSSSRKILRGHFPDAGPARGQQSPVLALPFPWDVPADTVPLAFAKNAAGTEVTATFWVKVFPKQFRRSNIELNDDNLQKVVGELDPERRG